MWNTNIFRIFLGGESKSPVFRRDCVQSRFHNSFRKFFSVYMPIKSKTSRNFLKASPLIASQLVALEASQEWLSLQAFLRDLCLVLLSHSCFKLLSSFLSGNSSNGETKVSKGIFYWRDFPTKKTLAKKTTVATHATGQWFAFFQVVCLCKSFSWHLSKYACLQRVVGTVLIDTRDGVASNKTDLIRETSTHTLLGWKHPNKQQFSVVQKRIIRKGILEKVHIICTLCTLYI